ncbi:unnamed protein product [Paramecium primaurelia]|uniref:Uncharacterized protein n=1 Tax=Paramecium primaurelia TaxID=5886 RepID=A0A8S1LSN6_PARPR|nr:unnamed protein product [Paramecium primaurelia]
MRPQSPKMFQTQTIATTRIVSSPPRDTRQDSCSRLAKVTTCQTRPKATITTLTNKPAIETRTVVLCNDKKCQGHENLIEQLTQDNNRLNQRIHDLGLQIDKYDNEQQTWLSTAIEIESMRKLLEETQKNHQQEILYLNSEINNFKTTCQYQEDKIKSLHSQIKQKQQVEEDYQTLTQEMDRYKFIIQDKNDQLQQQEYRIQDYEKQLQVGENVIEERNQQISILLEKINSYEQQFITQNNMIHLLKQEIQEKDIKNQLLLQEKDSQICNQSDNLDILEQRMMQDQQLNDQKIDELQNDKDNLNKIIVDLQLQLTNIQEQNNHLNEQVMLNDQVNVNLLSSVENQTKNLELQLQSQVDLHQQRNQDILNLQTELYNTKLEVGERQNLINSLNEQIINLTTQMNEKNDKIELLQFEILQQIAQTALQNNIQLQKYLIINEELKIELNLRQANEKSALNDLKKEIENKNQLLEFVNQLTTQIQELEKSQNLLENEVQMKQQQIENQQLQNENETEKFSDLVNSLQKQVQEVLEEKAILQTQVIQIEKDTQSKINQLEESLSLFKQTEDKIMQEKQDFQEQLLMQCLEVQRLQNENKIQKEKLKQQSDEIEQLNQKSTLDDEYKLLLSKEQDQQIQQQQIKMLEISNQCVKLKSDLKLQEELNEELQKKISFYQAQISHLQEAESQLRYLNEQNTQQQKNLQKELEIKNETENTLKFKLDTLLEDIKIKQIQLVELDRQLQMVDQSNMKQQLNLEEKIIYLQNEVEMWKEKFVILNRDYHRVQEDLMMVQAEFDAFNKRGLEIKNIKESTCFEIRKSSLYKENIDIKGSQTSIGRLFKENI